MYQAVTNRGGIEDTRLEAKAKASKKSEAKAKGSPSDDTPFLRPRTGMLEATAKDTGTSVLQKFFFFRRSQKKVIKKDIASARAS